MSKAIIVHATGGPEVLTLEDRELAGPGPGQVALRPDGSFVGGSVAEQTEQVMSNLEAVLKAAGTGFEHVVKATCFLTDMGTFDEFNRVYGSRFPGEPPARTTVAVAALPKGAAVEVELVARVP